MRFSISKEDLLVAIGYIVFITFFYLVGATKARFESFVAMVLLSGFYFLGIYVINKIRG
jgi:hypothetical protein